MKKNEQRLVLQGMNDIATLAGDKLERYQKKLSKLQVTHKDAQGVVSEADINTEKFIIKNLRKIFPMADVLGEEDYYVQKRIQAGRILNPKSGYGLSIHLMAHLIFFLVSSFIVFVYVWPTMENQNSQ